MNTFKMNTNICDLATKKENHTITQALLVQRQLQQGFICHMSGRGNPLQKNLSFFVSFAHKNSFEGHKDFATWVFHDDQF